MSGKKAKTEEKPAAEGEAGAAPAKKKMSGKKLILFIVLPVLLLAGAGGGAFFFLMGGKKEEKQEAKAAPPKPTLFVDLPDMLVNLNSGSRTQSYLKLKVAIELDDPAVPPKLDQVMPRVLFPGVDGGTPIAFVDPEIGDRLIVVPVRSRAANAEQRDFAQFALLPSLYGLVVEPRADGVVARIIAEGVEITTPGGLMLSGGRRNKPDTTARPMLLRYPEWRQGGTKDFAATKQALQKKVVQASEDSRNTARLDLARFYFANDLSAEALGILARVAKDDPVVERSAAFRAVRGVAYLHQGNLAKAGVDLNSPALDNDPEFALWRGELAARQDDWKKAHDMFLAAGDAAAGYPGDVRGPLRISAARAHMKAGDTQAADAELRSLENDPLTRSGEADLKLLRGELAAASGDNATAVAEFDRARAGGDRRIRALAELAAVNAGVANGTMKVADAIERLDKNRYAWRGDGIEFDLLRKLGNLQLDSGDYRAGFATMKQAMTWFPKSPDRPALAHEMTEAFAKLFLSGETDKVAPLTALALHQEFKELTPVGPRGDEIIRHLADRLAAVDLLDRAAGLLEHQVNFRLNGEEKARVAARLAVIQLLDRKPEAALKTLQVSAAQGLPPALAMERKFLEARAHADMNKYGTALALLDKEQGRDAETLRVDILWRAKEWAKTAAGLDRLLDGRAGDDKPLTAAERRQVLQQALALSMAGDTARLTALNEMWGSRLAGTPEGEAFMVATTRNAPGEDNQIRQLAGMIAKVGQLESFMASYRERVAKGGLSAIN